MEFDPRLEVRSDYHKLMRIADAGVMGLYSPPAASYHPPVSKIAEEATQAERKPSASASSWPR